MLNEEGVRWLPERSFFWSAHAGKVRTECIYFSVGVSFFLFFGIILMFLLGLA